MFEKIIDSFEKLCLQIIIEIILVPVTVYKLFQKSSRCHNYAVREMAKEDGERFKDYLSPIKLSVYTSVIISILIMDYSGQQNFIARISGLNMVEKALIIFMVNNFTAIVFSLFVLRYKKQKVNSPEFKTLLFSFIYTSVYTALPSFLLTISIMAVGQTTDVESYVKSLEIISRNNMSVALIVLSIILIVCVLLIIGVFKLFHAYRHILRANLPHKPYIVFIFTILLFACQMLYSVYFLWK